jgi:hypothetical protein
MHSGGVDGLELDASGIGMLLLVRLQGHRHSKGKMKWQCGNRTWGPRIFKVCLCEVRRSDSERRDGLEYPTIRRPDEHGTIHLLTLAYRSTESCTAAGSVGQIGYVAARHYTAVLGGTIPTAGGRDRIRAWSGLASVAVNNVCSIPSQAIAVHWFGTILLFDSKASFTPQTTVSVSGADVPRLAKQLPPPPVTGLLTALCSLMNERFCT